MRRPLPARERVEDGVADRVTHLVGVPLGHRSAEEKPAGGRGHYQSAGYVVQSNKHVLVVTASGGDCLVRGRLRSAAALPDLGMLRETLVGGDRRQRPAAEEFEPVCVARPEPTERDASAIGTPPAPPVRSFHQGPTRGDGSGMPWGPCGCAVDVVPQQEHPPCASTAVAGSRRATSRTSGATPPSVVVDRPGTAQHEQRSSHVDAARGSIVTGTTEVIEGRGEGTQQSSTGGAAPIAT